MRKVIGWVLFVVGVIVLCLWGKNKFAADIQNTITNEAASVASQFDVGAVDASVSGRDITLRGVVLESDHKDIVDAFHQIDGRRVVNSELELAKYFGPNFDATFDAGTGLAIQGSTTSEVDGKVVATLLTAPLAVDKLTFDSAGNFGAAKDKLQGLSEALPMLDQAKITVVGDQVSITGEVASNVSIDDVTQLINGALSDGDTVELAPISHVADGDVRTNVWTGQFEVYSEPAGRWLPSVNFDVTLDSCQTQTDKVLAENKILFVTGSAELDAASGAAIDSLAGTFRHCLADDKLALELGGHTDSDGDDQANKLLSEQRAQSVVDAIASLGINTANVTARGYGEDVPIAENNSDEGKAANRRTTIVWSVK